MEISKVLSSVVNIHNQIVQIAVRGDDAIIMANAIVNLRNLANELQGEIKLDEPVERSAAAFVAAGSKPSGESNEPAAEVNKQRK